MTDATDRFRAEVEARVATEFGAERDAERVADAAARFRRSEGVEWSPSFVAARMADAPRERTVPEKWNWLLGRVGGADAYELDGGALESDGSALESDDGA